MVMQSDGCGMTVSSCGLPGPLGLSTRDDASMLVLLCNRYPLARALLQKYKALYQFSIVTISMRFVLYTLRSCNIWRKISPFLAYRNLSIFPTLSCLSAVPANPSRCFLNTSNCTTHPARVSAIATLHISDTS